MARAQGGILQISSCLASPCTFSKQTSFRTEGAAGLLKGLLPALLRQLAAVRLLDPEEPAGAEGEGQGCERRFFSQVHGDAMHLSGDE